MTLRNNISNIIIKVKIFTLNDYFMNQINFKEYIMIYSLFFKFNLV